MNEYERLTRKELIALVRELRAAQPDGGRANGAEGSEFPVFGEREQQDFEKSAHPIRIFDRETLRYLAVNDAALKLYGYTREEFLRLTPLDTRHPEEVDDFYTTLPEPTGYLRFRRPRRHVTKAGRVIVVEIVTQDIVFHGRRARLSVTRDVTQQTWMQELLRRREREFSALAENAPDIIARFDRNLRFLYVNPAVSAAMGIPRKAFVGKMSREIGVPEPLVAVWGEEIRRVFETCAERTVEFECVCHDDTRYFEARLVPESGPGGVVETVLTISRDITARKRAEDELKRQKKLFEAVFENLPIAVFMKDASTLRFVRCNRFARRMYGYPAEIAVGKTVHDFFPKDQADEFDRTDREALATGCMVEIPVQNVLGRAGEMRIQQVRKVPVFDENGKPWVVVGIADDITERKRAERMLRESEEFLRRMIDSSRDCIKVLDLDGRITWVNLGGQALMEVDDAAALLGKSYLEFWGGVDGEAARDAVAAAGAGSFARFEGCCATAGGTRKWWDEIVAPMFGPDGKPEKLLVVSRDISERKRVEYELERQKKLLDAVFEHSPVGITVKDANTLRYLLRNRRAAELTGLSSAETIGKCADDVYPPALAEFIRERDRKALSGAGPIPVSTEVFRHRTGCAVRNLRVPVPDETGQFKYLIIITEDLTDIEATQAALRRSEERLKQLLSMSPAAIFSFSLDAPLGTTYVSENVRGQVGWEPSDFTGSPSFWFDHVHPDDRAAAAEAVAKLATEGRYSCEYRFHHKDGSWRWMHDEAQVVHDANGTRREAIGIWMDITAQREEAEERLQRALRQRDALVKEVHHRIKNHLQGIAGLLRQEARSHPGVAPLIETVVAQMKSVALVYGLQNSVDTAVPLGPVLAAICASLEHLMPCRVVRKWDVEQEGSLRLDANEAVPIAVALNELVYNALKHGDRSIGAATIEVDYAERGPRAEIRVANRGALPPGFDYATGVGCRTGLDLVKTLLGPKGSTLAIWSRKGTVQTTLTLDKPLVTLQSLQTAA